MKKLNDTKKTVQEKDKKEEWGNEHENEERTVSITSKEKVNEGQKSYFH